MSGLFGNYGLDPRMQRQALINKYNAARINLLAVVVFTVINMITLAMGIGSYLPFSANMPYMLTFLGLFLCGMLPEQYYEKAEGMVFMNKTWFIALLIISILIIILYVVCWLLSRKGRVSWLKVALGMFLVDSVAIFLLGSAGFPLFDILFHVWVIAILISGIKAHAKIKALPKEDEMIEADYAELPDEEYDEYEESEAEEETVAEIEAPKEKIDEEKDGE